jgi:host factor-I protein
MNRKLIRPKLAELKSHSKSIGDSAILTAPAATRRKRIPPEQTNAESFYYLKQMANKTSVIVVMHDGEELRGVIEWYDRDCLKVNRNNEPNLVVMKRYIKYIFKERERR